MKTWSIFFIAFFCFCTISLPAEQIIANAKTTVRVHFQTQNPHTKQWTGGSTTTQGAVTESMMANQISSRYGGQPVRILSVSTGAPAQKAHVRYCIIRGTSRGTASATLTNALTPSMARHQLEARHPKATILLMGFSPQ